MIDKRMEKTFVLAYPCFYYYNCIGNLMRCMNVSEDFAREHLNNINWNPEAFYADVPSGSLVGFLTSNPVVAMIIEGDNSVQKVSQLTSKKERPFWDSKRASVYASESGEQALLDIALWFRAPKFDITQSKTIVFMLPRGEIYGPRRKIEAKLKENELYELKPELQDNFALENMCVFLIKPLAFRDRCVGEILDAIESNSYGVRGLTLVKISVPNKGWLTDSLSTIDDDECGLAVVAYHIKSCFKMRSGNIKKIDHDNKVFEIGSDYLHKSEPGQGVLEAASEFFHHGYSVWEYQGHRSVFGGIFQASLVGLDPLQ
ncbi:hypothetical protein MKW92_029103 [Papaver armeniacum]|nr:hypothetical protein MKW92_029103 [Papaver armeniacum]